MPEIFESPTYLFADDTKIFREIREGKNRRGREVGCRRREVGGRGGKWEVGGSGSCLPPVHPLHTGMLSMKLLHHNNKKVRNTYFYLEMRFPLPKGAYLSASFLSFMFISVIQI